VSAGFAKLIYSKREVRNGARGSFVTVAARKDLHGGALMSQC
jgi:hypothetical protein